MLKPVNDRDEPVKTATTNPDTAMSKMDAWIDLRSARRFAIGSMRLRV